MEGVSSWLDGHDWTSVESGSPASSHCLDGILLQSEDIIAEGRAVVLVNIDAPGTLLVTNFRLIFIGEGSKQVIGLGTIPLATIEKLSKQQPLRSSSAPRTRDRAPLRRLLQIVGKDMRVCVFGFRPHSKQRRSIYDALLRVIRPLRLWDMFAFSSHVPAFVGQTDAQSRLRSEYLRIIGGTGATRLNGSGSLKLDIHYRLSDANADYTMCPTYPSLFVVPASVSDDEVQQAAIFRARGRVPVLCWLHPENGAVLVRSSQPLIGIMMNSRSNADEKLVATFCTSISQKHFQRRKLYIADARPRKNALANGAMGGGSESSANYFHSEVVFLGIDNIHAMRDSLGRLRDYVDVHGAASSDGSSSLLRSGGWGWGGGNLSSMTAAVSALGDSGWLMHAHGILAGAAWIAARISLEGASVLVHCSDGWDRTTQLISLAGLMLDPYYRTFQGFQQALVEKDWLAFGHPFADRLAMPTFSGSCNPTVEVFRGSLSGSVGPSSPIRTAPASSFTSSTSSQSPGAVSSNYSPIFVQWVDCVAQLLRLYPRAFEFSSAYLVELLDCVLSCRFGNFLCNSEKERLQAGVSKACECVWKHLDDQRSLVGPEHDHFNLFYNSELHSGALLPPAATLAPILWPQFHLRWACPSDMLTGYSTPTAWAQGGELEMQARLLARRITSMELGKESAEEKVKDLVSGVQSMTQQLQAEKEARKSAVAFAARAHKEAAALRRAVETLGCKIRFTNLKSSMSQGEASDEDTEINDREKASELPTIDQGATNDGSSFDEQDQFSVSVSLDSEADIPANHFRKTCQQEYGTSCSKNREGCKWPQNGCSRMGSGLLGLRANFDALEQLSILDSYFDVEHVQNPSTYSYHNKSHPSGVT
ncbi:hypothetical protein O6H91_14G025600 [Diphasiastrum complanatum]|nr:hypothetical protein O6H91_14G025600 [Diphasiastrum complanatum]